MLVPAVSKLPVSSLPCLPHLTYFISNPAWRQHQTSPPARTTLQSSPDTAPPPPSDAISCSRLVFHSPRKILLRSTTLSLAARSEPDSDSSPPQFLHRTRAL